MNIQFFLFILFLVARTVVSAQESIEAFDLERQYSLVSVLSPTDDNGTAQSIDKTKESYALEGLTDSSRADTIPRPPKRKLLPSNMSFMERALWDEDGLVRGIGIASPLTPEVRKSELGLRRTMLTMHQIGGFLTLGLMATTVYWGQQALNHPPPALLSPSYPNQPRGKGGNTYTKNHQLFLTLTLFSYGATGALAIFSPPPLIRRDETSTTTLHKALAWIHFGGMVLTPILGSRIGRSYSATGVARFHQVSAYITTATLAASLIVVTF